MLLKLLSYPRSIFGVIFTLAFTGAYSAIGMVISMFAPPHKRKGIQNFFLYSWAQILFRLFSIQLTVNGLENLGEGGVMFVFNHSSHFDIPVFYGAIRKTTRFGAKIELYKIPIFSSAMHEFGILPIARSNRDEVLKLYQDSIVRVHQGESFILAAEGSRNDRDEVGEKFKSGPFIFAINGQFPIQPLVFKGVGEILPKSGWLPSWGRWQNPVTVTILPPVPTKGLTLEDRETLKQTVQQMMTKAHAQS